jgi:hypothetical protein
VLGAASRELGIEDGRHPEPPYHLGRAADVVALRVRQHDGRQRAHSEPPELSRDVRLGRPLVDEQDGPGRLDEHGIALPDVEERDPEAVGRSPGRRRPKRAGGGAEGQDDRDETDRRRATPVGGQPPDPRSPPRPPNAARARRESAPRRSATRHDAATKAIHAAHQPESHANATAAPGSTGSIAAAARARPISGGIAGSATTFAGTVQTATAPKWSQTMGAVTAPQATATATRSQSPRGTG